MNMIEVCKHVVFVAFMQTAEQIQNEFFIIFKKIYAHLYLFVAQIKDSPDMPSKCASFLVVTLFIKSSSNQINQVIKSKNSPNWWGTRLHKKPQTSTEHTIWLSLSQTQFVHC